MGHGAGAPAARFCRCEAMPRTVAAGIGLMEFPFRTTSGFWRWVDLCEQGGVDSIWQSDRLVSRIPTLECMTALAAIAGRIAPT